MPRPAGTAAIRTHAALLLLVASTCSHCQAALTTVDTPEALKTAIDIGAPHIEIRAHLNLSALTSRLQATSTDPEYFALQPTTRSIRGNCSAASSPPFGQLSPPLVPLSPYQCVLLAHYDIFEDDSSGTALWLDRLFLRFVQPPATAPTLDAATLDQSSNLMVRVTKKALLATNVTFHGGRQNSSEGLLVASSAYIAGCELIGFAGDVVLEARGGARVTVADSTVSGNSMGGGALYIDGAALLLRSVTLARNTPVDIDLSSGAGAVFADDATRAASAAAAAQSAGNFSISVGGGAAPVPPEVAPEASIPGGTVFPDSEDAAFVALRADTHAAQENEPSSPSPTDATALQTPLEIGSEPGGGDSGGSKVWLLTGAALAVAVVVSVATGAAAACMRRHRGAHAGAKRPAATSGAIGYVESATGHLDGGGIESAGSSSTAEFTWRTLTIAAARTTAAAGERERLERALDNATLQSPPSPFLGRFLLVPERAKGGQAVIQFARAFADGMDQYAIKFFLNPAAYALETALYETAAIRSVLPRLVVARENAPENGTSSSRYEGLLTSPSGFVYPPFVVVARGVTMAAWLRDDGGAGCGRSRLAILTAFQELAGHLACLHGARIVHRDIKPENILIMVKSQRWALIDFGIAAKQREEAAPHCTAAYAAPEVVRSHRSGERALVDTAQDVWSLGATMFECITGTPAFPPGSSREALFECAAGERSYPWEKGAGEEAAWHLVSQARCDEVLRACLARDASHRPSAATLVKMIERL